jgi:hypothetical protein
MRFEAGAQVNLYTVLVLAWNSRHRLRSTGRPEGNREQRAAYAEKLGVSAGTAHFSPSQFAVAA